MATVILPHNMASEGAKALSSELGFTRIRREQSRYKHKADNVIINWGCSTRPPHVPEDAKVLNTFDAVAVASNKLRSFECMSNSGVNLPPFTRNNVVAKQWQQNGHTVFARTILNGHAGNGIIIAEPNDPIPDAPLYVCYVPKKKEYRVHVFKNRVIDVVRKVLREDHPDKENVNWKIRNHDNGFIFTRLNKHMPPNPDGSLKEEMCVCPNAVKSMSVLAVHALGLDFGAVDVIWNERYGEAYVLEVNTAPGIADTACERYAQAFTNALANMNHQLRFDELLMEIKRKNNYAAPLLFHDPDDPEINHPDDDDDDNLPEE